jgi:hypothetical protein
MPSGLVTAFAAVPMLVDWGRRDPALHLAALRLERPKRVRFLRLVVDPQKMRLDLLRSTPASSSRRRSAKG